MVDLLRGLPLFRISGVAYERIGIVEDEICTALLSGLTDTVDFSGDV